MSICSSDGIKVMIDLQKLVLPELFAPRTAILDLKTRGRARLIEHDCADSVGCERTRRRSDVLLSGGDDRAAWAFPILRLVQVGKWIFGAVCSGRFNVRRSVSPVDPAHNSSESIMCSIGFVTGYLLTLALLLRSMLPASTSLVVFIANLSSDS